MGSPTELDAQVAQWRGLVGRGERRVEFVTAAPVAALAAVLDRDELPPPPGSDVPPLSHWLYFPALARQGTLGPDGRPPTEAWLPPVPLPRMGWTAGRLEFAHALQVGDEVERTTRLVGVDAKRLHGGTRVVATLRHEVANAAGVAVREEQDIAWADAAADEGVAPVAAPSDETVSHELIPDPVLLFRWSALMFDAHRLHYDHPYATGVAGRPALAVPGPLLAMLLMDLLRRRRPRATPRRFSFTQLSPAFGARRLVLCARDDGGPTVPLWCRDAEGILILRAEAKLD